MKSYLGAFDLSARQPFPRRVSAGPPVVQLLQEAFEVAQPAAVGRVTQRLVLRKNVDEPLADVVAVPAQQVPSLIAQRRQDVADLALGAEGLRHSASRSGGGSLDGRASDQGPRPAFRLHS